MVCPFVVRAANPAPRDRVLISVSYDGTRGPWLPIWRVCTPGYGAAQACCGTRWSKFVALWAGVREAIATWDRYGRPGPVFGHLTSNEQAFLLAGGG